MNRSGEAKHTNIKMLVYRSAADDKQFHAALRPREVKFVLAHARKLSKSDLSNS